MVFEPDYSDIQKIENGLLANRPCLESVTDGAWVWRFANGYTGRANSLQSLDVRDDHNFAVRLDAHWQRSKAFGISPRFRVTPLTPPNVVEHLLERGFVHQSNTLVMNMGLVHAEPVSGDDNISLHSVLDAQWQKDILRLENVAQDDAETFIQLMAALPKKAVGLSLVGEDGTAIGAAYASLHGEMGSVFGLVVDPEFRGRGLGRQLMNGLLNWMAEHGAKRVTLQVVADNGPAMGLYSSLGFVEAYKYYYLVGDI